MTSAANSPNRAIENGDVQLSLTIPCYNEESVLRSTVEPLAEAFQARGIPVELVVVDNGSTDSTSRVIDELIRDGLPVVKRHVPINCGYGNGILQGLAVSRAPLVGFIHADGQTAPDDVVRLFEVAAASGEPTLVKVHRCERSEGLKRMVVSRAFNLFSGAMFPGLSTADLNGSPKIMPRETLHAMNLVSIDWFLDLEIMLKARHLKLPVTEVEILSRKRAAGKSHVNWKTWFEFVINLLRWRIGGVGELCTEPASQSAADPILDGVQQSR